MRVWEWRVGETYCICRKKALEVHWKCSLPNDNSFQTVWGYNGAAAVRGVGPDSRAVGAGWCGEFSRNNQGLVNILSFAKEAGPTCRCAI